MAKSKCCKGSCKLTVTSGVKFTIFKSKKNKEFYCRASDETFGEITFSTEGHKNRKDVRDMLNAFIAHIQSGQFTIETLASSNPQ